MPRQTSAIVPLSSLPIGAAGVVARVGLAGAERRRLFDLGLVPGTRIECAFESLLKEPKAYRVRGALIALRHEQASEIEVAPI